MIIGNREFDLDNKTYIMGILNITPDSFYDGNRYETIEKALKQAEKMVTEGADIIDVGGMSTRPGHKSISPEEELQRVIPAIKEIRKRFDIPLSIDTYRSGVAAEALEAGADMVNDIWGGRGAGMADVISRYKVPCCLMHNNTTKVTTMDEVIAGLKESIDIACSRGISDIIIDPGIGFAKVPATNMLVIKELNRLEELNRPILLGASNKSFIGYALDLPSSERLEGTLAITAYAVLRAKTAFLRVHEVKENSRIIKMLSAIADA